jgi:hypothetical protein
MESGVEDERKETALTTMINLVSSQIIESSHSSICSNDIQDMSLKKPRSETI